MSKPDYQRRIEGELRDRYPEYEIVLSQATDEDLDNRIDEAGSFFEVMIMHRDSPVNDVLTVIYPVALPSVIEVVDEAISQAP